MSSLGLNANETRVLKALKTPERIQRFLDTEIEYNNEPDGDTIRSPRRVLRDKVAHCIEGALFGAAALRFQGYPPLLLDMEAVRDDDHVLAIFKQHGHWGAIAQSNFSGLRFREPVYRTLRELVMSYFEHYYNLSREKTLRSYSRPVNLKRFDRIGWMTAETDLWSIAEYLTEIPHVPLLCNGAGRRMARVDKRLFAAGLTGRA
ncbi:MAG TPA: hypothetical protein VGE85_03050 [Terracidiphilus sp.]|jgi:hypothetical protein